MADCPYCLQPGATGFLWFVKCPNAGCPKYDQTMQNVSFLTKEQRRNAAPTMITMDPARPVSERGSGFKRFRLAIAVILIILGGGTWLLDKAGVLPPDVGGRHGITIAIIGFMLLPSRKPKQENEPAEEKDSPEPGDPDQPENEADPDQTDQDQTRQR